MDISILVIEDDPDHRYLLDLQLRRAGFTDLEMVDSLDSGFHECEQRPRDVVIIDSGVAGENRDEAVKGLRRVCGSGARLVAYSAGVDKERWADAHFMKGTDTDALLKEVAKGPLH